VNPTSPLMVESPTSDAAESPAAEEDTRVPQVETADDDAALNGHMSTTPPPRRECSNQAAHDEESTEMAEQVPTPPALFATRALSHALVHVSCALVMRATSSRKTCRWRARTTIFIGSHSMLCHTRALTFE
jgi:hypothetical protein